MAYFLTVMNDHRSKKLFFLKGIYPKEEEPSGDNYGHQGDTGAPLNLK
jgi:hypothetical protein